MSKKAAGKMVKKAVEKHAHPPFLETYIKAGQALPAPPLGPQLGAVRTIILFYRSYT